MSDSSAGDTAVEEGKGLAGNYDEERLAVNDGHGLVSGGDQALSLEF